MPATPSHRRVALMQRRSRAHKNCPSPHATGGQLSSIKKKQFFSLKINLDLQLTISIITTI